MMLTLWLLLDLKLMIEDVVDICRVVRVVQLVIVTVIML